MSLVDDVRDRIGAQVADLTGRVETVADLAALIAAKQMPQRDPWSFVVPLGFDGGAATAATGMFQQDTTESVGVILVKQSSGDAKGAKAAATIDGLVKLVVNAVAGWRPSSANGAMMKAGRGRLVPEMPLGVIVYELQFSVANQLRIT